MNIDQNSKQIFDSSAVTNRQGDRTEELTLVFIGDLDLGASCLELYLNYFLSLILHRSVST